MTMWNHRLPSEWKKNTKGLKSFSKSLYLHDHLKPGWSWADSDIWPVNQKISKFQGQSLNLFKPESETFTLKFLSKGKKEPVIYTNTVNSPMVSQEKE